MNSQHLAFNSMKLEDMTSHCIQVNSPLIGRSEIFCYKIVELAFHTITAIPLSPSTHPFDSV